MNGKSPRIHTFLQGPEAQKVLALDRQFVSPSYAREYPLVAKRGEGMFVEDVDGNTFLDFSAGIAVVSTGHCHPDVVRALQRQSETLIHMSGTDFYYPLLAELARKMAEITPGDFPKRVYFGNSGTEAIEGAMKIARHYTKRHRFIAFLRGFHGRTYGALSLTASRAVQRKYFGPLLPGVTHAPYAYPYRCPCGAKPSECAAQCNCAEYIENQLFKTIVPPEEVAAIVVEPIQGEGGYIDPPARFLPLGITVARSELMDWDPGAHASTFGGNPLACAAAMETIRLLEEKYISNAARMGQYIMQRLSDWTQKHRTVGEVRGLGLMIGIELVKDQSTCVPNPEGRRRVIQRAFENGLLLLSCGESTVRLMPALILEPEHADAALDILDQCIAEIESS
jgi:4-aminobutyrate aminotransferase